MHFAKIFKHKDVEEEPIYKELKSQVVYLFMKVSNVLTDLQFWWGFSLSPFSLSVVSHKNKNVTPYYTINFPKTFIDPYQNNPSNS